VANFILIMVVITIIATIEFTAIHVEPKFID